MTKSWTEYDERSWEYAAGKVLSTYRIEGPSKKTTVTYEDLFDKDMFDAIARKAMSALEEWTIDDQVELLASKQHDYGHENIERFGKLGVRVRLWDKLARLANLEKRGPSKAKNESVADTLRDIVGYCAIYGMVQNGTFSHPLSTEMEGK